MKSAPCKMFRNFKSVISRLMLLLSKFQLWSQNWLRELYKIIRIVKTQVKLGLNSFQGDLN